MMSADIVLQRKTLWMLTAMAIIIGVYAVAGWHCAGFTADDAFISFRYAENLAGGRGLVFNSGEKIEGYSNFLWVLLLGLLKTAGLDPVVYAKFLGMIFAVTTLVLVYRIGRSCLELTETASLAASAFLASNIGFVYYSVSGLETILYGCLLTALLYCMLKGSFAGAGCVAGLLILTRPEGVLAIAALGAALVVQRRGAKNRLVSIGIPAAVFAALTGFRIWYFGDWLPNTFTAKIQTSMGPVPFVSIHTRMFLDYTIYFGRTQLWNGWLGILIAAGLAQSLLRRKTAGLPLLTAAGVFFVWFSGTDWMDFSRFYVHILSMVALLMAAGADSIHRLIRRNKAVAVVLIGVASGVFVTNLRDTSRAVTALKTLNGIHPAMSSRNHISIGLYLKRHYPHDTQVVAEEIGAIGYYSGLNIIDFLGLTDRSIARMMQEGDFEKHAETILARQPRVILFPVKKNTDLNAMHPLYSTFYVRMNQSGRYKPGPVFPMDDRTDVVLFETLNPKP